jgi:hypothetical protein
MRARLPDREPRNAPKTHYAVIWSDYRKPPPSIPQTGALTELRYAPTLEIKA